MTHREIAMWIRIVVFRAAQAAILAELGYIVFWAITHHSHTYYWGHFGGWALMVLTAVMLLLDVISEDGIERWTRDDEEVTIKESTPDISFFEHGGNPTKVK